MSDLPNFGPVTLDEAIIWANTHLAPRRELPQTLGDWVLEETQERLRAKAEYEAADIEIAGVSLKPGDWAHLTIHETYSKPRRLLNCAILGARVVNSAYTGRSRVLSIVAYGGNPDNDYGRPRMVPLSQIEKVEKVSPPLRLVLVEAQRAERMKGRGF